MSLHDVWQVVFDFLPKKPVCAEPVDEHLSTDARLLVFRQWDEQRQFTEGFAEQLDCRWRFGRGPVWRCGWAGGCEIGGLVRLPRLQKRVDRGSTQARHPRHRPLGFAFRGNPSNVRCLFS